MYGYKIKKHNGKYYFALYPNNNPNQRMGQSKEYQTLEECRLAISSFRDFVSNNHLNKPIDGKVQIICKKENVLNKYYFNYIDNDEIIFFRTSGYGDKDSCLNGIDSIYNNILQYTTNEL